MLVRRTTTSVATSPHTRGPRRSWRRRGWSGTVPCRILVHEVHEQARSDGERMIGREPHPVGTERRERVDPAREERERAVAGGGAGPRVPRSRWWAARRARGTRPRRVWSGARTWSTSIGQSGALDAHPALPRCHAGRIGPTRKAFGSGGEGGRVVRPHLVEDRLVRARRALPGDRASTRLDASVRARRCRDDHSSADAGVALGGQAHSGRAGRPSRPRASPAGRDEARTSASSHRASRSGTAIRRSRIASWRSRMRAISLYGRHSNATIV